MTTQPTEPIPRMQRFAKFFRGYMGAAPVVAAAMPIPVSMLGVIPLLPEVEKSLTAYCSMFCFLAVAFVFYRRHRIGAYLMPDLWTSSFRVTGNFMMAWLPMLLVGMTAVCILLYHVTLSGVLAPQATDASPTLQEALKAARLVKISPTQQMLLFSSYLGIYLCSTLSFAIMAVREYMQTELGLDEGALVRRAAVSYAPAVPRGDTA